METNFKAVVQSWLDGNFDEATKAEILALQENDIVALEDAFYRADKQSRLCFACPARDECRWDDSKKNLKIRR